MRKNPQLTPSWFLPQDRPKHLKAAQGAAAPLSQGPWNAHWDVSVGCGFPAQPAKGCEQDLTALGEARWPLGTTS